MTAGRAGCCVLKYLLLSPIHFYSQSENNLPYNNTDTHSTAPGTHPSGHDATAQSSPEVRGEPQPGELCPFSIPRGAPTPSCSEHNLTCGWRNLCTVLVCPPHFPPTLGSLCPAVHHPILLRPAGCQQAVPHPHAHPPPPEWCWCRRSVQHGRALPGAGSRGALMWGWGAADSPALPR